MHQPFFVRSDAASESVKPLQKQHEHFQRVALLADEILRQVESWIKRPEEVAPYLKLGWSVVDTDELLDPEELAPPIAEPSPSPRYRMWILGANLTPAEGAHMPSCRILEAW